VEAHRIQRRTNKASGAFHPCLGFFTAPRTSIFSVQRRVSANPGQSIP
jgi:hypothetical protein